MSIPSETIAQDFNDKFNHLKSWHKKGDCKDCQKILSNFQTFESHAEKFLTAALCNEVLEFIKKDLGKTPVFKKLFDLVYNFGLRLADPVLLKEAHLKLFGRLWYSHKFSMGNEQARQESHQALITLINQAKLLSHENIIELLIGYLNNELEALKPPTSSSISNDSLHYLQLLATLFTKETEELFKIIFDDPLIFFKLCETLIENFPSDLFPKSSLSIENIIKTIINFLLEKKIEFNKLFPLLSKYLKKYPSYISLLTEKLSAIISAYPDKIDFLFKEIQAISDKSLNGLLQTIGLNYIKDPKVDLEKRKNVLDALYNRNKPIYSKQRQTQYQEWFKLAKTPQEKMSIVLRLIKENGELDQAKTGYRLLAELLQVNQSALAELEKLFGEKIIKPLEVIDFLFKNANISFDIQYQLFNYTDIKVGGLSYNSPFSEMTSSRFWKNFHVQCISLETQSLVDRKHALFKLVSTNSLNLSNVIRKCGDLAEMVSKLGDSSFKNYAVHFITIFNQDLSFENRLNSVRFVSEGCGEHYLEIIGLYDYLRHEYPLNDNDLVFAAFAFFNTQDVIDPTMHCDAGDTKCLVEQHTLNTSDNKDDLLVVHNDFGRGFSKEQCSRFYKALFSMKEHLYKPRLDMVEKGLSRYQEPRKKSNHDQENQGIKRKSQVSMLD